MAVPKKKTSKSKKGMRRSHHNIPIPKIVYCECGAPSLPHRVCPECGKYKGQEIVSRVSNEE